MKTKSSFLPMWDVGNQLLLRGGICASFAQVRSTGLQDVSLSMFRALAETLNARPSDQTFMADLEKLLPAHLSRAVRARLNGIEELSDPGLDEGEQRKRLATILTIRAKGMTRPCREARSVAERTIEEGVTRLRNSTQQAYAAAPDRSRSVVEQMKRALKELTFPAPDTDAIVRFQRALKAMNQLAAVRSALVPTSYETVVSQLKNMAHRAYEGSLNLVGQELSDELLRAELAKLIAYLDELAARGTDFSQRMHGTLADLERRQKEASQAEHVSRASVVMALQGPDEKEVVAGMIARNRCADVNQLAAFLLDAYEARLRQGVSRLCPYLDANTAALPDIIRAVTPSALAEEFLRLVEESVGPGHTVYEVIAKHGVETVATFLYRRAAPTCHLGERDVEAFNISPVSLAIVRLPPTVGSRDSEIREALMAAFRKKGNCTFTEGTASDRSVTAVRVHLGWPIGIAEENRSLLDRYLRSGERGHLPHLVKLVPDAPLGTVSPAAKELAVRHHR